LFAEQSTAALSSLSESYSGLDTALSSSRALVRSLLRSQKSDTWYLETAFYILVGTITWLIFRRILYGPLWWFAWMPVKLVYRLVVSVIGVAGLSGAASTSAAIASGTETIGIAGTNLPPYTSGGGNARGIVDPDPAATAQVDDDSMVERIGKMVEESREAETHLAGAPFDGYEDYDGPRNPKKRMWEEPVTSKDEL
jgi:protein transport protein SEC20